MYDKNFLAISWSLIMNKLKILVVIAFTQNVMYGIDLSFDFPFLKKNRYVAVKNLHLHQSPNMSSNKILKFDFGEKLVILSVDKSTHWAHVTFKEVSNQEIKGYVPENALISDDVADQLFNSINTITNTADNLTVKNKKESYTKKEKGFSEEEENYTSRKYKKGFGEEAFIQKRFSKNGQSKQIQNILSNASISDKLLLNFMQDGGLK